MEKRGGGRKRVEQEVQRKRLQVFRNCGCCDRSRSNLCKKCYNERGLKQGGAEVAASKWRALIDGGAGSSRKKSAQKTERAQKVHDGRQT